MNNLISIISILNKKIRNKLKMKRWNGNLYKADSDEWHQANMSTWLKRHVVVFAQDEKRYVNK